MNIIETNFEYGAMDTRKSTTRIILHHTATVSETAEQIHDYHKNSKKWAGAGYHFFVRKDGSIYRLRPEDKVGAHAYGSNFDSIGVAFEGNFMEEEMPIIQKESGKELVAFLKNKYGINKVQRHRDVDSTSCPGDNFPFEEIVTGEIKPITPETPIIDEHKELVKRLQTLVNQCYGTKLDVDGIIGPLTTKAIREKVALKNYCANALVGLIQERLIMHGYGVGNTGIDSKYGKATENAVRRFQANNNLKVDGIVGFNTIKALF